jgi:hypothetical protein
MMPDVGAKGSKRKGVDYNFSKITNNSHWEIFVSLLVRNGVNFLIIIVEFSVINLIKADISTLFHREAFPEKAVSTLKLSSSTGMSKLTYQSIFLLNRLLHFFHCYNLPFNSA